MHAAEAFIIVFHHGFRSAGAGIGCSAYSATPIHMNLACAAAWHEASNYPASCSRSILTWTPAHDRRPFCNFAATALCVMDHFHLSTLTFTAASKLDDFFDVACLCCNPRP